MSKVIFVIWFSRYHAYPVKMLSIYCFL
jgi:hypothetical protein